MKTQQLELPITIYAVKYYRIMVCIFLSFLFYTITYDVEWLFFIKEWQEHWVLLLMMVILGLSLIYLLITLIKPKPCMLINQQGITFFEFYFQKGKFFTWQDIQHFHFIVDGAVTIDVYLKDQTLLDIPQRFEYGFDLKLQNKMIHGKQTVDILNQCLIQSKQGEIDDVILHVIPLTLSDKIKRFVYFSNSSRNLR